MNSNKFTATLGPSAGARISMKSPNAHGEFDEHDYSLSVSDLNNSMFNSGRGAALQGSDIIPPRFKY